MRFSKTGPVFSFPTCVAPMWGRFAGPRGWSSGLLKRLMLVNVEEMKDQEQQNSQSRSQRPKDSLWTIGPHAYAVSFLDCGAGCG
jgi:hypothetical protein